ncbi:MAG: ATP synthase F1 subunit delta, partial [Erysipelotrichaceae bacterium]|nr:ATP synthase F1 subunit delta [Erysipelotrichaceae bacterium]
MSVKVDGYARNLMELANQEGQVELLFSEIKRINDELNRNAELSRYIDSSDYSSEEKKAKLQEVFHNDLDDSVLYAMFLVIDRIPHKHTERALIHAFMSHYYHLRGYLFGQVYSANELDRDEMVNLEAAFSYKLKHAIRLENKLDKSLIGGVKVMINGEVWDGSYKARMDDLRNSLLEKEHHDLENISTELKKDIESYDREMVRNETTYTTGYVTSVADGVANISGIYDAMAGELLDLGKTKAMVMDLEEHNIAAVLLGNDNDIIKGTQVYSTGKVVEVPVGDALLGRVVDALGRPIDGKGAIQAEEYRQIEANAPGVIERQPVNEP